MIQSGKYNADAGKKKERCGGERECTGQRRLAEGAIQWAVVCRRIAVTEIGENLAERCGRRVVDMGLGDIGL